MARCRSFPGRSVRPRPRTAPGSSRWTTPRPPRCARTGTGSAPRLPRSGRSTGRPGSCSPTSTATRWPPDRPTLIFRRLTAEAGLPPVQLHDLRHGAASLAAGVDLRVVQEMLGHSSIVLTADTYTSVLPAVAHAAAEKVATLTIQAGCPVPGTRRHRRRQSTRGPPPRSGRTRAGRNGPAVTGPSGPPAWPSPPSVP